MTSTPAPGWYPDPAGTNRRRWWDGRGWTEHVADGGWDGTIDQPPLAQGAQVNTVFIWIIALLPLVSAVAFLAWDVEGFVRRSVESPRTAGLADAGYLLLQGTSLLLYVAQVVLALLDRRALQRMGVVKPFHWAWSFLSVVYLIGRTVVLRRRVHRGLAPLLTYLGVAVLASVIVAVRTMAAIASLAPILRSLGAP
jgi:hypothetical protein